MSLTVLVCGPLTTVQDAGRPGLAAQGVGRSGACDRRAYRLANRLVGNDEGAAALELTFGGLAVRAERDVVMVTTGARCPDSTCHDAPVLLRAGQELGLGAPASGLRTYLAVRGGIDVEPVLGSRSTDVLAAVGPPPLTAGMVLPIGLPQAPAPAVDLAPVPNPPGGELSVRVLPGPRRDWFPDSAWAALTCSPFTVSSDSNRVGVRLTGPVLERRTGELLSEGMVRGALQVPPSGHPVLFLPDHPVTGGYPVIAYVMDDDVDACGQLRPGQTLRMRAAAG